MERKRFSFRKFGVAAFAHSRLPSWRHAVGCALSPSQGRLLRKGGRGGARRRECPASARSERSGAASARRSGTCVSKLAPGRRSPSHSLCATHRPASRRFRSWSRARADGPQEGKRGEQGKGETVQVGLGGRRYIKQKKNKA